MRKHLAAICLGAAISCAGGAADAELMNGARLAVSGKSFAAQNGSKDWSLRTTGTPSCTYRFEVRSGDRWYADIAVQGGLQERSELTELAGASVVDGFDTDIWTAYQFMIEPGSPSTSRWVVMGDWHVQLDPGDSPVSSPWQMELLPGDFLTFYTATSPQKPVPKVSGEFPWKSSASVTRGAWHSVVSKVNFDWQPDGKGEIQLWFDGAHVVDRKGSVGFNESKPAYFKFGLYRYQTSEPLAVRYANVEISRISLARWIERPPRRCEAIRAP